MARRDAAVTTSVFSIIRRHSRRKKRKRKIKRERHQAPTANNEMLRYRSEMSCKITEFREARSLWRQTHGGDAAEFEEDVQSVGMQSSTGTKQRRTYFRPWKFYTWKTNKALIADERVKLKLQKKIEQKEQHTKDEVTRHRSIDGSDEELEAEWDSSGSDEDVSLKNLERKKRLHTKINKQKPLDKVEKTKGKKCSVKMRKILILLKRMKDKPERDLDRSQLDLKVRKMLSNTKKMGKEKGNEQYRQKQSIKSSLSASRPMPEEQKVQKQSTKSSLSASRPMFEEQKVEKQSTKSSLSAIRPILEEQKVQKQSTKSGLSLLEEGKVKKRSGEKPGEYIIVTKGVCPCISEPGAGTSRASQSSYDSIYSNANRHENAQEHLYSSELEKVVNPNVRGSVHTLDLDTDLPLARSLETQTPSDLSDLSDVAGASALEKKVPDRRGFRSAGQERSKHTGSLSRRRRQQKDETALVDEVSSTEGLIGAVDEFKQVTDSLRNVFKDQEFFTKSSESLKRGEHRRRQPKKDDDDGSFSDSSSIEYIGKTVDSYTRMERREKLKPRRPRSLATEVKISKLLNKSAQLKSQLVDRTKKKQTGNTPPGRVRFDEKTKRSSEKVSKWESEGNDFAEQSSESTAGGRALVGFTLGKLKNLWGSVTGLGRRTSADVEKAHTL